jgi:hypothetical protein
VKFNLACPTCGKSREFSRKSALTTAEKKGTSCFSCRSVANNIKRTGTKTKEKNPAWKGFGCVPGKVFSKLKRDAEKRNLPFEITIEDIYNQYNKQKERCAFTGFEIFFDVDASVDSIDSSKGYTIDNIQIVHKLLNMMKRNLPNDEFILWCRSVYIHNYE